MFRCFPFTNESKTSLCFLAQFDAVETEAVEAFKFTIGNLKIAIDIFGRVSLRWAEMCIVDRTHIPKDRTCIGKRGVIPHKDQSG